VKTDTAALAADTRSTHGEGPCWDAALQRLLWVDIMGCRVNSLDPITGKVTSHQFQEPVCVVVPEGNGRHLIAFAKRLASVDLAMGDIREIVQVEPDKPDNRCNDGKSDPAGRFWIGTMSAGGATPGAGSLYCLDGGGRLTRVLDGLTISNGMGWTADARTMFFIDSPTREVWAFDFDPADSSVTNRRTVIRVPDGLGVPDGMCVAPDDTIWVAHWGAGCVGHWDPRTGALLGRIETSCPHTSSCCLTPDGSLFITTSRLGLDEASLAAAPLSGSLLFCSPDHRSAQPASSSAG
jgi:sugar lactone lactonase YvrE